MQNDTLDNVDTEYWQNIEHIVREEFLSEIQRGIAEMDRSVFGLRMFDEQIPYCISWEPVIISCSRNGNVDYERVCIERFAGLGGDVYNAIYQKYVRKIMNVEERIKRCLSQTPGLSVDGDIAIIHTSYKIDSGGGVEFMAVSWYVKLF